MAEITIQVSDLDQLISVVSQDFLHIKQVEDNGDYKITVEDFAATLAEVIPLNLGDLAYLNTLPSIAGNGLTSVGTIPTNYFLSLGTPSTISRSSTNTVTSNSHSHAIDSSVTTIKGGIILFHGTFIGKNPVPLGGTVADNSWQICDGTNGTPDMRDRVPIGSGGLYPINSIGGSKDAVVVEHNHSAVSMNAGSHKHGIRNNSTVVNGTDTATSTGNSIQGFYPNPAYMDAAGEHNHPISVNPRGESGVDKNLPPYRALAYIMKV